MTHGLCFHSYFTVLNVDGAGQYKQINKGLRVDEENQEEMRMLLKAQKRLSFEQEEKSHNTLPPLDLSI